MVQTRVLSALFRAQLRLTHWTGRGRPPSSTSCRDPRHTRTLRSGPHLADSVISADLRRTSTRFGPTPGKTDPKSDEFGLHRTVFLHQFALVDQHLVGPRFGQVCPNPRRLRPFSSQFPPNSDLTKFGSLPTGLRPIWATSPCARRTRTALVPERRPTRRTCRSGNKGSNSVEMHVLRIWAQLLPKLDRKRPTSARIRANAETLRPASNRILAPRSVQFQPRGIDAIHSAAAARKVAATHGGVAAYGAPAPHGVARTHGADACDGIVTTD